MKYKVGDICEVVNPNKCGTFYGLRSVAKYVKITEVDGDYRYDILDDRKRKLTACSCCFRDSDLKLAVETLENLDEGDTVYNTDGEERRVLFTLRPGLYVMSRTSDNNAASGIYTAAELKKYEYALREAEPAKEVTMAEVCEKFGYDVKIKKED